MQPRLFMHSQEKKENSTLKDSIEIVSGGQTGVDRAALDIAIELNVAGPRESQSPGIYKSASDVIFRILNYSLLHEIAIN